MRPSPVLAALLPAAALAAALAGPARADAALVLATGDYDVLPDLSGGARPAGATDGIAELGFEVVRVTDGDREETARALARFAAAAREEGRLVVALSGRFATDGQRTWLLTADSPEPTLFGLNSNAVSVESLLRVMAGHPSRAILLLGRDAEADDALDPWLREGVGALSIPQGVTVVTGTPRAVADLLADEMARPRADLAPLLRGAEGLRVQGYLPDPFRLMPAAPEAAPPVVVVPDEPTAAEAALWQGAAALDTVEAYRNYLRVYPQGAFAGEARAAVASIEAEPNRAARLEEESLRLSRGQRTAIQRDLATLDFDPRGIDGVFGPGTRAAIVNWQQQAGYPQTSYLDAEQVERLSEQARERLAADEARQRAAAAADDELWRRTGAGRSVDGMRAYLARYPEGRHAEEAEGRIAAVEAAVRQAVAEEREAFDAAAREGTVRAYDRFLADYPDGRLTDQAREARRAALARQQAAEEAERRRAEAAREAEQEAERESEGDAARDAEAALGLTPLTARVIEARLEALGIDPGRVDGTFDSDTRDALRRYQERSDLPRTGYLDEPTLIRLVADTLGLSLGD